MFDFLPIGSENAIFEKSALRRFLRGIFGHVGLGYAVRFWNLKRALKTIQHPMERVLDFGSSDGMFTFFVARTFPGATIEAIDGDEDAIKRATWMAQEYGYSQISFSRAAFEDWPLSEHTNDLVLCLDALYYTLHGHRYLENMCNSLRPGGVLILSLPYLNRHYSSSFSFFGGLVNPDEMAELYEPGKIRESIEKAGLTIKSEQSYPSRLGVSIIRSQAARRLWTRLLYPFLLILLWLDSFQNHSDGTHIMLVATKPL